MASIEDTAVELSRGDLRRAQILEAAAKCFNKQGFHGASMASIAAEAMLSVGQIYRYFENKEAVIAALVELKTEQWGERLAELRARSEDPIERMVELAAMHAGKLCDPEQTALWLEVLAEAARNERIHEIIQNVDAIGRARMKHMLIEAGVPDDAHLETGLNAVGVLLDGWAVRKVRNPTASTDDYLRAVRVLLECLLKPPA